MSKKRRTNLRGEEGLHYPTKAETRERKQRPRGGHDSDAEGPTLEESFDISQGEAAKLTAQPTYFCARVVEVHKRYAFVSTESRPYQIDTNDVWIGTIARRHLQASRRERNVFSVGDIVICQAGSPGQLELSSDLPSCTVEFRIQRSNVLSRKDPMVSDRSHVLAANVDHMIIVSSYLAPKVKWGLIDRYLVAAESQGIEATIVVNKSDLLAKKPKIAARAEYFADLYQNLGYRFISLAAVKTKDTDPEWQTLQKLLAGRISLVSGHSGVGKSSIVNLFNPQIVQDVETESILTKGRHTTSYASFIKLGSGGFVIDTPGIRSFVLDIESVDLGWAFRDLRPFADRCQYRSCQHLSEPGCEVQKAIAENLISKERYRSYVGMLTGISGREGRIFKDADDLP